MIKRFVIWLTLLAVLAGLPVTAFASPIPDTTRDDCSIEVILWDKISDKGIVGAELVCYRVGYIDVDAKGAYGFYDVNTHKEIQEITKKATADAFYKDVKKNLYKDKYKETFEKEGVYYFTDLPTGLYLVVQTKAAKKYGTMSPFLVSVPYLDDGEYVYKVTAASKTELLKETKPTKPPTGTTPTKLPQTGQLSWPIPVLASGGMLLFALGWWLCFRRKEDYET